MLLAGQGYGNGGFRDVLDLQAGAVGYDEARWLADVEYGADLSAVNAIGGVIKVFYSGR